MLEVEFDPAKDAANLAKHGVSLARAAELAFTVVRPDLRRDYGEPRWLGYGILQGRLYVLAFTRRDGRIRAISLRRANQREIGAYGQDR